MVEKKLWLLVKDVRSTGGRMMKMILDTKPKSIIIAACAPQTHLEVEEKESFYNDLQHETGKGGNQRNKLIVVVGDFNARVGQPRTEEEAAVIGKHAMHTGYEDELA